MGKYKYLLLFLVTAIALFFVAFWPDMNKEKKEPEKELTPMEELAAIEVPELPDKEKPKVPPLAKVWNINKVKRGAVVKGLDAIKGGILIDATKGDILWAKNENDPLEIASMTKMMTTLLALEADERGEAKLDGMVNVSAAASKIGGSQVYLAEKEKFTLGELLKCVMIMSANDAAFAVAETLGGNVDEFVAMMNKRAGQLGMKSTKFNNPHGLPQKGANNKSSALDMAMLARELLKYPKLLEWTSTKLDTFRDGKFQLSNRNSLVGRCQGVDGMKTGFYAQAGYCVTATCLRNDRRMIAVIIGAPSKKERDDAVKNLLNWGYQQKL